MKVIIRVVDQLGKTPCHRGLKVGDVFDFEEDRGKICPLAMHTIYPFVNILRYDGTLKSNRFSCPDVDTLLVFELERVEEK